MLGAGSIVPPGKVLESGYLYVGSPAKMSRPLKDSEKEALSYSATHYRALAIEHEKVTG
jgi:carbonic anhydrase/acetyltransferase-like protein (isoleucine patch superfamily)